MRRGWFGRWLEAVLGEGMGDRFVLVIPPHPAPICWEEGLDEHWEG